MARAELIAEAERELAEQELVIAEGIATYRGIEARLASLKEGVAIGGELVLILEVFVHPFWSNPYTRSGVFVHPGESSRPMQL